MKCTLILSLLFFNILLFANGVNNYQQNASIEVTTVQPDSKISIEQKQKIDSLNTCIKFQNLEIELYKTIIKENKKPFDFLGIGTVLISVLALIFSNMANRRISEQGKKELREKYIFCT
jgi:preprotein translocase subunit SecG